MKKRLILATLLVLIFGIGTFAFSPSELNKVTFVNDTGATIDYLFLSPGDSAYWGPDILGSSRILDSGDSLGFYLHYPDNCNDFDILAINSNSEAFVLYDYTVCDDEEVTIEIGRKDFTDDPPEFEYIELSVRNATDYAMHYVFISPSDSQMWGVDMLDESTILEPGDSFSLFVPADDDATDYDFMSIDEDNDAYKFTLTVSAGQGDISIDIDMDDYVGN